MQTIILQDPANSVKTEIKVDSFATLAQLQEDGFDTRFTGMTVVTDDTSIKAGAEIIEKEYSWQDVKKIAVDNTLELHVVDLNDKTDGPGGTSVQVI